MGRKITVELTEQQYDALLEVARENWDRAFVGDHWAGSSHWRRAIRGAVRAMHDARARYIDELEDAEMARDARRRRG